MRCPNCKELLDLKISTTSMGEHFVSFLCAYCGYEEIAQVYTGDEILELLEEQEMESGLESEYGGKQ